MPKIKVLTQEKRKFLCNIRDLQTDTVCLKEVLYAVKRDLIEFIGS